MSFAPKISIVTPLLNGSPYIADLLCSLKDQSLIDWEHIIVDGGSTDDSLEVVTGFYRGDDRLKLIQEPGLGLYASVMRGFEVASGQILGWQNADDRYTPWAFECVANFHATTGAGWVTGYPGCWDQQGTLRYVRPYGWYSRRLIARGWHHLGLLGFLQQESIFFTRTVYGLLDKSDLDSVVQAEFAGDFILWKSLARKTRLSVVPSVLSGFRRHAENKSHNNLALYMDEVANNGGKFFPSILSTYFRRGFKAASAIAALSRVEIEDRYLSEKLERESLASDDSDRPMPK